MNIHYEHVDTDDVVHEDRSMETYSTKKRKISDSQVSSSEPHKELNSLVSPGKSTCLSLAGLDRAHASVCSVGVAIHDTPLDHGKDGLLGCSMIDLEQKSMDIKNETEMEKSKWTTSGDISDNLLRTGRAGVNCEQAGEAKPKADMNLVCHLYADEEKWKESRKFSDEEKASDDASTIRRPIHNQGQDVVSMLEHRSYSLSELDAIKQNVSQNGNKEDQAPPILSSCTDARHPLSELDDIKGNVTQGGNKEYPRLPILNSCTDTSHSLSELVGIKESISLGGNKDDQPPNFSSFIDTIHSLPELDATKENVAQCGNKEDQPPQVSSFCTDTSHSLSESDAIKENVAQCGNKEDQPPQILSSCTDTSHSLSKLDAIKENVHQVGNEGDHPSQILISCSESAKSRSKKKLLVLDVNGLLADIVVEPHEAYRPDYIIGSKAVFKRPYCDEFLRFCFERFDVGVWSSRTRRNIERALDFLIRGAQRYLLFCWDQSHCTDTGFSTIENRDKPLLLKELRKLWEKQDPNLPWDRGEYDESNTLLLDDSPYKALLNPPHTAIFPYSYRYRNRRDNFLGPRGEFRDYLERLAVADNVQKFVEQNPFGQRPITERNLSWKYYLRVIDATSSQREADATSSSSAKSLVEVGDSSSKSVDDGLSEK